MKKALSVIPEHVVERTLNSIGWPNVISAVAETFVEEARGNTLSPPKIIMELEEHNNDYRVMPSYMSKHTKYCGCKIVCACPNNPKKYKLPLVIGMYILNSADTQETLMVCDASTLTAWRTAAATTVAIRKLTDQNHNKRLGIIGCGLQARYHISAISAVIDVDKVLINDLSHNAMASLQSLLSNKGYNNVILSHKKRIFETCDIVVTLTPTKKPHIFASDIPDKPMVIASVGGDSAAKSEIGPEVLAITDHYCDSYDQVMHTGTMIGALDKGIVRDKVMVNGKIIEKCDLKSIGDLMVGKVQTGQEKVKLFLSTGVALEDLAVARLIYEYLEVENVKTHFERS